MKQGKIMKLLALGILLLHFTTICFTTVKADLNNLKIYRRRRLQSEKNPISISLDTGKGGCSGIQEARIDIYRGSFNGTLPKTTVLHLPGGAYLNLANRTIETSGAEYIDAGYTVAVLYYRLPRCNGNPNQCPTPMPPKNILCSDPGESLDDVTAAMELLRNRSEEYHVDPNNIVLSGFSAGGHLAALYGTTCTSRGTPRPRAMVLHFPFLSTGAKIFCAAVGSSFTNLGFDGYEKCFPAALVDSATPPTLLYHMAGDALVPTEEMVGLDRALAYHGVAHEYYEVPGGGHRVANPFRKVVDAAGGALDELCGRSGDGCTSAALIERVLDLPVLYPVQ